MQFDYLICFIWGRFLNSSEWLSMTEIVQIGWIPGENLNWTSQVLFSTDHFYIDIAH